MNTLYRADQLEQMRVLIKVFCKNVDIKLALHNLLETYFSGIKCINNISQYYNKAVLWIWLFTLLMISIP